MASNNSTVNGHLSSQDVAFAVMYSFIVIIGVPANCIIITIVRKTPSMHTTTNYLLMNLAVADLTTLMFCPGIYDFSLNNMKISKAVGDLICKFFAGNAVVPVTIRAASLIIAVIAVERYLAMVKPFRVEWRLSKNQVPWVVAFLWAFSVLSCIPDFMTNTIDTDLRSTYPCKRPWSLDEYSAHKRFIIFVVVYSQVIPCLVVFFCYFEIFRGMFITNTIYATPNEPGSQTVEDRRAKKQLFKLLISLTLIFSICTLPFSIFFFYLTDIDKTTIADNRQCLFFVHRIVRFLLIANSFFNPLVYAFQSSNYRKGLKRIFCCKAGTSERNEVKPMEISNVPLQPCSL